MADKIRFVIKREKGNKVKVAFDAWLEEEQREAVRDAVHESLNKMVYPMFPKADTYLEQWLPEFFRDTPGYAEFHDSLTDKLKKLGYQAR